MGHFINQIVANVVRKTFHSMDVKRDSEQTTPKDIIRFDDITYGNDTQWPDLQLLDVYRPKFVPTSQKLPVIVSVHGGGWVYGDKNAYQFYCMRLAQKGFAVVNFSYRLAPESIFPSSLEDTEKVFQWICNHAEQFGLDTLNVFAVGDSAGSHLLSLYSAALSNQNYAKNFPFIKPKKLTLRAVALNCGKYKFKAPIDGRKYNILIKGYLPQHGTAEELNLVDATLHITKDFPPAFIMTCKGDFYFPQNQYLIDAMEKAGANYEFHCYGTPENPLQHVFHLDPYLQDADLCTKEECTFFKKFLSKNQK